MLAVLTKAGLMFVAGHILFVAFAMLFAIG